MQLTSIISINGEKIAAKLVYLVTMEVFVITVNAFAPQASEAHNVNNYAVSIDSEKTVNGFVWKTVLRSIQTV